MSTATPHSELVVQYLKGCKFPHVVDIGAYTGEILDFMIDTHWPFGLVVGIEADPINYEVLKQRWEKNPQAVYLHGAIGGSNGEANFYTCDRESEDGTSQSNTIFKKGLLEKLKKGKIEGISHIRVPMFTMDEVMRHHHIEHIDLVKMNCEGAEYDILHKDAPTEWLKKTGMLWVCLHNHTPPFTKLRCKRIEIAQLLRQHGLALVARQHPDKKHIWQLWRKA